MSDVVVPLVPDRAGTSERPRLSTYIVTGCAGFIGSHLAETLLQRGDAVIGIDAFTDYYPAALKHANLEHLLARRGFIFLKSDLVDAPLGALVPGVDGVFHLAAQPGVRGSWGQGFDIYARDNLLSTQRVLEAAAAAEVRVVFASSSSVYGDAPSYPTHGGHAAAARLALRGHQAVLRAPRPRLRHLPRARRRRPALLHRLRPAPAAGHGRPAHRPRRRRRPPLPPLRQRRAVA